MLTVRNRTLLLCLLSCTLGLLTGCPGGKQIRDVQQPKNVQQVDALLAKIKTRQHKIQGLEGRAKLRVYRGKKRQTIRLLYQFQRPNMMNIALGSVFGQPVAIITSDGKQFAIHYIAQKQFVRGPVSKLPSLIQEFLPVSLPLEKLIPILMGEVPLLSTKKRSVLPGKEKHVSVLTLTQPTLTQKVWLDLKQARFLKTEYLRDKEPPLTLTYGTYRGTPPLPKVIRFHVPKTSTRVRWIYVTRESIKQYKLSHFRQKTPTGVEVRVLTP